MPVSKPCAFSRLNSIYNIYHLFLHLYCVHQTCTTNAELVKIKFALWKRENFLFFLIQLQLPPHFLVPTTAVSWETRAQLLPRYLLLSSHLSTPLGLCLSTEISLCHLYCHHPFLHNDPKTQWHHITVYSVPSVLWVHRAPLGEGMLHREAGTLEGLFLASPHTVIPFCLVMFLHSCPSYRVRHIKMDRFPWAFKSSFLYLPCVT